MCYRLFKNGVHCVKYDRIRVFCDPCFVHIVLIRENTGQRKLLFWHNYEVVGTKIIFAFQNINSTSIFFFINIRNQ